MNVLEKKLYDHLAFLYGEERAPKLTKRFLESLYKVRAKYPELADDTPERKISEKDAILITYGDMVQKEGEMPLKTLGYFLRKYLNDVISTVHILPFYPYSSDDGFSVIDYRRVNSDFGDWEDIERLSENFRLMFDAVINHTSAKSAAFQGFLKGDPKFEKFFTVVDPNTDLTRVFRPRATPVLTPFETASGTKHVWTTFSADQVDLNFANPDVLLEVADILLFYAAHGAEFIRLDAVTFVWKEIGTECINSPQTHRIVQIMRTILDIVAPNVIIITETNVPHQDNIAYFGDGTNEAQMVYNFALPILTLHAFHKKDVRILSEWADMLEVPSQQATFFNFLAGHDGIGMLPVKNILSLEDLSDLAARTQALGGNVSYKSNEDGSQSPYELNINYLDALRNPNKAEKNTVLLAQQFLATQAIMLALRGVPGIYFHSLFGSRNWTEGVKKTGRYRTINREKVKLAEIEKELQDTTSLRYHIFQGYKKMLKARLNNPAFHPYGAQKILSPHPAVFALLRTSLDEKTRTLCLQNVSSQEKKISISLQNIEKLNDLLSEKKYSLQDNLLELKIAPYEVLWLTE
ncbi:MAG TPA: sugar phosphorylase [Anaerolineales bacterium]|nr:sugar phosphorylase [Anaerolineales bacterium]